MAAKRSNLAAGCVSVLGFLFIIGVIATIVGPQSDSSQTDSTDQPDTSPESQDATKQAAAEAAKKAHEQDQEDADDAKKMGVSIAVFKLGEGLRDKAYDDCTVALINSAHYEHKTDWAENFTWRTDGQVIMIFGRDIHLQNAYGAYSASYSCVWDMNTKSVISVDTD
jgi:hypothetical protein